MAMKRWACLAVFAAAGAVFAADAPRNAPKKDEHKQVETFTDAAKAGVQYKLQGEYEGGGKGVQVIALGEEGFRAVIYAGGLPGAGWDGSAKTELRGKLDGGNAVFQGKSATLSTDGETLAGKVDGNDASFKKVMRQSPTLGAKPPEGAVVLYDGKSADQWEPGKMTEDGLLVGGCKTKQKFTDFAAHVEFILPFMPDARGQGRGNSGVYLQDRYEVQVLDSFGLKGENNECGGIYTVAAPKVNMCLPPLVWQTYDIEFTAARFDANGNKTADAVTTVRHNGVVIQDNQKIPHPTGGGQKEGPTPGPFQLQNHGNPVFYRNIWVVEKK